MGRYCQLVMGPAGSGKSTYCATLTTHLLASKRSGVRLLNLDPAAEHFEYEPTVDVKELIQLEDVTQELGYGPNGGLIYCMEYLIQNLPWLDEQMSNEDDVYWLIDCPGQIELYTHFNLMTLLVHHLQRQGYHLCAVYCLETTFLMDPYKFFSGALSAMSCMIQLELPHVNVLTKMDLIKNQMNATELDRFLFPDSLMMEEWIENEGTLMSDKWKRLNQAVTQLLDSYNMIAFLPLDITDEDSINDVLSQIDLALQYGEDVEPQEPKDDYDY